MDDRTRGISSPGEQYHDEYLLTRPKHEWAPYIDETAKDLSAQIQIGDLSITSGDFGDELGGYYRRGLEQASGRHTDLPAVLDRQVTDAKLGLLAYRLNELSHDITTSDLGIKDVEGAAEAIIEKILTRNVGSEMALTLGLSGASVADITTQLFKNETVAANVDLLVSAFGSGRSRGLLQLLDEPQMMTSLWDHQREALAAWVDNDYRGYVDMATATGKTVLGLATLALHYGELHPDDDHLGLSSAETARGGGRDDVLIVAHNDLILEQWRREFDRHLNIPSERTSGGDDITLEWGTIHFRTAQRLVNQETVDYDLVLLDEAHHYATGTEWGSLLDAFDGHVLALSGSVDDAGADSGRIKRRLENTVGPEVTRYTITDATRDGVIPSFDWEIHYAPYEAAPSELRKIATRTEDAFEAFRDRIDSGDLVVDTDRRLRTYEDVRRFSHTTEGNELKQSDEQFRELVTRLFSRRAKRWNLSPSLDAVVDITTEHYTTEHVVVLAESNAQVEELESRLQNLLPESVGLFRVSGSQSRTDQRETIDEFDDPERTGVLLGTGDLLGEGVDMHHASVAINLATGGVNPELVQRIGRVLRNPTDTPKHAMFYNVVGVPPTAKAAVPREDGLGTLEAAAQFCGLGRRFDKLPGFATAASVDLDTFGAILRKGASFIRSLDTEETYEWETEAMSADDLTALVDAVEADEDVDTVLGEWEEYAWEHSDPRDDATTAERDHPESDDDGDTHLETQPAEDTATTPATVSLSDVDVTIPPGSSETIGGVTSNPLAEYYEVFGLYEDLLERVIEACPDNPNEDHPIRAWYRDVHDIVYGDGPTDDAECFGQQQQGHNTHKMTDYRETFGGGYSIRSYHHAPTAVLSGGKANAAIDFDAVDDDERLVVPVAPGTLRALPLWLESDDDLAAARELLGEFPDRPSPESPSGDSRGQTPVDEDTTADTDTTGPTEETEASDQTDDSTNGFRCSCGQTWGPDEAASVYGHLGGGGDGHDLLATPDDDSPDDPEGTTTVDPGADGTSGDDDGAIDDDETADADATPDDDETSDDGTPDKMDDDHTDDVPDDETGFVYTREQQFFWDRDVDTIDVVDATPTGARSSVDGTSLDAKIDEWKSQLLDLSRRNSLISFTPSKTKTLPFDDVDPLPVCGHLYDGTELHIHKRAVTEGYDEEEPVEQPTTDETELLASRDPGDADSSLHQIGLRNKRSLRERGVDTLYLSVGMLRWYSTDYSDEADRSPLFLIPVDLEEKTISETDYHDYVLAAKSDAVQLNPALRKKLAAEHGVALPADESLSLDGMNEAFETVYEAITGFGRWRIQDDVVVGIFDFVKFSLYTDLEENRDAVKSDQLIRALNGDTEPLVAMEGDIDTPSADSLDDAVDPIDTYQVLDADSSQQAAIEAAKRGKSFVLQGPPGTGKSQTISNIIAEKLAAGEKVLFVSEKQAALDVVKSRLDDVGLGRFCLEVHGAKATNTKVLSNLAPEIDGERVKPPQERPTKLRRLRERREAINEYGDRLFFAPSGWDTTVYQAFGIVSDRLDAPRIATDINTPHNVDPQVITEAVDSLETLAQFDDQIEREASGLWRHTTLEAWGIDTGEQMRRSLTGQQDALEALEAVAVDMDDALDVRPRSLADLREVTKLLDHLQSCPDIQWREAFFEEGFTSEGGRLDELAELEQRRQALREELESNYEHSFFQTDGASLHDELAGYGLVKVVRPSYRSLKRRILSHATDDYDPGHDQLLEDTRSLSELQHLETRRQEYQGVVDRLGPLYEGSETDWETLAVARRWAGEFDSYDDVTESLEPIAACVIANDLPDVEALHDRLTTHLARYDEAATFFEDAMATTEISVAGAVPSQAPLEDLQFRLGEYEASVPALQRRIQYESHVETTKETIAGPYLEHFLAGDHPPSQLVPAFERDFYTRWLDAVYEETDLGSFSADELERYIEEFRTLDVEQQSLANVEIQHRVTSKRPSLSLEHASSSAQVLVRRESEKQRRHMPLRSLFDEAGEYITRLTPCFMMSPLSVAQYLRAGAIDFDVVVFDEASQIMPHDAVSSLIRADQAIIAGDTKQLPPTSFFQADVETTEDVREDLDSILEEAASVLTENRLNWHYRSRTSDLIEFSNHYYYDNTLRTFPENDPDVATGVEFEYVPEGVYDRGGTRRNEVEAEQVVDLIETHATDHSDKSLGVVAFSSAQEQAIRDALETRCTENDVLDAFVGQDDVLDEFFVKNLEMVQGDERDRMIFSVGYGPDQSGTVSMNLGPLNNSGGERRLNVAVTRAKERVTVVSSIQPGDIDLTRTNATGVEHFKRYLEYAKRGPEVLARDDTVSDTLAFDSRFEEAVYDALVDRGFDVVSQVESSNYSIDLGIKHPEKPGKFVLGIECDGAAYHSSKTARDRDRTRQAVLESLGWTIHRIWSPDWTSNRERQLDQIEARVERLVNGESESTDGRAPETYEPEVVATGEPTDHDAIAEYEEPSLSSSDRYSTSSHSHKLAVRNSLEDVVAEYGPIEVEDAYRTALDVWSESRLGKNVQKTFEYQSRQLQKRDRLVEHDGFLWPRPDAYDFEVRIHTDDERRSIDEIPIEEVAKAVTIILAEGGEMSRDDLGMETSRLFGYQRRGQRIQERVEEAVQHLMNEDLVTESDKGVRLDDETGVDDALLGPVYGKQEPSTN